VIQLGIMEMYSSLFTTLILSVVRASLSEIQQPLLRLAVIRLVGDAAKLSGYVYGRMRRGGGR